MRADEYLKMMRLVIRLRRIVTLILITMAYREDKNRLIYKFNGGMGAVLCSNCYCIMYEGRRIPDEYREAVINGHEEDFGPVFCCDECKREWCKTKEDRL
jgi:hypothetical protein